MITTGIDLFNRVQKAGRKPPCLLDACRQANESSPSDFEGEDFDICMLHVLYRHHAILTLSDLWPLCAHVHDAGSQLK